MEANVVKPLKRFCFYPISSFSPQDGLVEIEAVAVVGPLSDSWPSGHVTYDSQLKINKLSSKQKADLKSRRPSKVQTNNYKQLFFLYSLIFLQFWPRSNTDAL